jgi:hypothetical protein
VWVDLRAQHRQLRPHTHRCFANSGPIVRDSIRQMEEVGARLDALHSWATSAAATVSSMGEQVHHRAPPHVGKFVLSEVMRITRNHLGPPFRTPAAKRARDLLEAGEPLEVAIRRAVQAACQAQAAATGTAPIELV